MTIIPIFIFGENRNGTTALCNSIASFKKVFCAKHKYHWGSHESFILEKQKIFSEICNLNDYIRFCSLLEKSDYFKLLDIDPDILYKKKYVNYYKLFFDLMDTASLKNNCEFWVTKLSPQFCNNEQEYKFFISEVFKHYDNAKFICIERELYASSNSYLNMQGASNLRKNSFFKYISVTAYVLSSIHNYKIYNKEVVKYSGLHIEFDEFVNNYDYTINKIADYLSLKYKEDYDENIKFEQNSSYNNEKVKVFIPKWFVFWVKRFLVIFVVIFPRLVKKINRTRNNRIKRTSEVYFSFRLFLLEKMRDLYLSEIKKSKPSAYELIMKDVNESI